MMDWAGMGGFIWVAMGTWAILGVALILFVVAGIWRLGRQPGRDRRARDRLADRTAIEELDLRYPRGEVNRETFMAMRGNLKRDGG